MKKFSFLIAAVVFILLQNTHALAQAGNVYSIAGGGTSTADGVPATAALLTHPAGVTIDFAGNIYVVDTQIYVVRRIDHTTGLIKTVAGNGTNGFSGDGGPATNAAMFPWGLATDQDGNLYIADYQRIRKVNMATGIINTIAGGGTDTADGIAATAAVLSGGYVCLDPLGDIYVGTNSKARKIDHVTGIITTVAGNSVHGGAMSGDGGPATAAGLGRGFSGQLKMDSHYNLYLSEGNTIRKVSTGGIITTVVGGGTSTADGVAATSEMLTGIEDFEVDGAGNIFIYDNTTRLIRRVDVNTGIISKIAGGGSSMTNGVPASNCFINLTGMYVNAADGYIYYTTASFSTSGLIQRFSFMPIVGGSISTTTDSFVVSTDNRCSGPQIIIVTPNYFAGRSVKTDFGDGTIDSGIISLGYFGGGFHTMSHVYASTGNYLIKHILYSGTSVQDSISYLYSYTFCRTLPISIFYDGNGNCVKDTNEYYNALPVIAVVDSNGVTVDTISVTSSFNYDAYAVPGDVYSFRLLSPPAGASTTCPASGVISDTISARISPYTNKYFGVICSSGTSNFDLQVNAVVPVTGEHDQWGDIYIVNNECETVNGTVTLHYSPRYLFTGTAYPNPSYTGSSSITWNLTGISPNSIAPINISYVVDANPSTGHLTPGDTVWTGVEVTPVSGDANPANNYCVILDTVRAGCDPNEMSVLPAGCLGYGTASYQMQYTINFCNTGNDTAFNIVVLDTLNDNINPRSLRIVSASATMNVEHMKSGGYNIVQFSFPNINLLDSSYHAQCNGSVIFTANTIPNLADGSSVYNEAGIYFDYNPVVMTNQVANSTGCTPTSVPQVTSNHAINIYPNPANDVLNIKTTPGDFANYSITNSMGLVVASNTLTAPNSKINIKLLPVGIYYIRLTGDIGVEVRKFVKM